MDQMEQEDVGRIKAMNMNREENMNQPLKSRGPPQHKHRCMAVHRIKAMAVQGEKSKMQWAVPCFKFLKDAAMAAAEALRDCTARRQCLNQGEKRKLVMMVSKPVPAAAEALR